MSVFARAQERERDRDRQTDRQRHTERVGVSNQLVCFRPSHPAWLHQGKRFGGRERWREGERER